MIRTEGMTQAAMDNDTMVAVTQADRDAADEQIGALLQGDGRERLLAGKMDSLSLVQAFARHRHQSGRTGAGEAGWIVGNSDGTKWRVWDSLGPKWTTDRDRATRYARRVDAEQVHAEDEGAWRVVPYAALSQSTAGEDGT